MIAPLLSHSVRVRAAVALASALAGAGMLAGCSSDGTGTPSGDPQLTALPSENTGDAITPDESQVSHMRLPNEGATEENVAQYIRNAFPTWPEQSDHEISIVLNAACDSLDSSEGNPATAVDRVITYGVQSGDAAFGVLTAISAYCPEYSALLGGATTG